MKELISIAIIIATILGGTNLGRGIHNLVRKAALEKASQGIPALRRLTFSR